MHRNDNIIPWMTTEKYVESLYSNPLLVSIKEEEVLDTTYYQISFLENLQYYQMENNLPYSRNIHCFKMIKKESTEKYYRHLGGMNEVYLFFEEESRYTCSNSPELFFEERVRQGLEPKDIKERGYKYKEYLWLLDELALLK